MSKRQTKEQEKAILKEKFLGYYAKLPIEKYAGYSVGKSEDTIGRWKKEDTVFADRIKQLKSEYLLQKSVRLRAEFIIPLLFRELTPRQELTGKDGKDLPVPILSIQQANVLRDNSDPKDQLPDKED